MLVEMAKGYSEYAQLNAEALDISRALIEELLQLQREPGLPFLLLSDMDGKILSAYLGHAAGGPHETAIFAADR